MYHFAKFDFLQKGLIESKDLHSFRVKKCNLRIYIFTIDTNTLIDSTLKKRSRFFKNTKVQMRYIPLKFIMYTHALNSLNLGRLPENKINAVLRL